MRTEPWTDQQILKSLKRDARRRKRPPRAEEWFRATKARPCHRTVANRYGSWNKALTAAGLPARGIGGGHRATRWDTDAIIKALRRWQRTHRRWPTADDWKRSAPGRPCTGTVSRIVGSWAKAIELAKA